MKKISMIMAAILALALMIPMIPVGEAGAPAIETNATIGAVSPGNYNNTTVPSYINFTAEISGLAANETPYINLTGVEYEMMASGTAYYYNWTSNITEGIFVYWVVVRDNSTGNSTKSDNYTIMLDGTGPVIEAPVSHVEGNPTVITVTDAVSGVKNATITITQGNSSAYSSTINATNGRIDWSRDIGVGVYNYTITAYDVFGNNASANGSFEVTADTAAPAISDVAAAPVSVPEGGYVNITANISDAGVGVDTVMVNITYPDGTFHNMSMMDSNGTYYLNATYTQIGSYSFFIWANDTKNNVQVSEASAFTVTDATAPTIANVSTEPLQSANNRVLVIVNATDNYDAAGTLSVSLTILISNVPVVTNAAMTYNATINRYTYLTQALDIGVYNFTVNATDAAGNWAVSSGSFKIADNIAPVISNINIPSNIVEHQDITITAQVTDNVDDASNLTVAINLDGTEHDMTYNETSHLFTYTITDVTFGEHTFTITATDMSNNTATSEAQTFSAADSENPEMNESASSIPTEGILGEDMTFSVAISDDDSLTVTLYYSVDGGNETSVVMTKDENGNYVAKIKVDSGSELTYRIVADDGQGGATTVAQGTVSLSEKSTLSTAMLAGIGILLLIIIIAVVMMMKKKPAEAPAEEEPAEEESSEEATETEESEESEEEEDELGEDF